MRIAYLFTLILSSHSPKIAGAPVVSDCILFDVTFWQKELHLSKEQRWEISYINYGLYDSIHEMPREQPVDEEIVQMLFAVWRHSVYDVLSAKQKKKWRKIVGQYYRGKQSDACE